MMKQKVVIRVSMNDQKSRKKAMKLAVGQSGVISVALHGQANDQIEVVGEGIDPAALTISLRKNMAYAELLSVNKVDEKKDDEVKKETTEKKDEVQESYNYSYSGLPHYEIVEVRDHGSNACCTTM